MTKITIFSGFLGAGKTTLIKKLIPAAGEKLVLMKMNSVRLASRRLYEDAGIEVTEMNSGCICCSLVGDFAGAAKVLDEYLPTVSSSSRPAWANCRRHPRVQALHADVIAGWSPWRMHPMPYLYENLVNFTTTRSSASAIILSRTQNLPR
ncbi:MAG: GTP-binding protein [Ruthenibacterium lactatiformans]